MTDPETKRVELDLTDRERAFLAADALQQAQWEEDVRYWTVDPVKRAIRLQRWRDLAAVLYPEGYGRG